MDKNMDSLWSRRITFFPLVYLRKNPQAFTIGEFIDALRNGRYGDEIEEIRAAENKKEKQELKKENLPAVMISGYWSPKNELREESFEHSNLLQLDFDHVDSPSEVISKLTQDQYVFAAFVSPSGKGVKAIVHIDGDYHDESFEAAKLHYEEELGIPLDPITKNKKALCFFSYDPNAYISPGVPDVVPLSDNRIKNSPATTSVFEDTAVATSTTIDCITSTSEKNPLLEKILIGKECDKRAKRVLRESPEMLNLLWENYFEKYYDPDFSQRNSIAVDMVTNLYKKIGEDALQKLAYMFYEIYKPMFNDSLDKHMHEVSFHIETIERAFEALLNSEPDELEAYKALGMLEKDAFRICRDLAAWPEAEDSPPPFFWLSYHDLGIRLQIWDQQASRLMRKFRQLGILDIKEKGTKRAKGKRAQATMWKWNLSLKEVDQ